VDRARQIVAQDRLGPRKLAAGEHPKLHTEFALVFFRILDRVLQCGSVAIHSAVARAPDEIVGMGFADEDVVLARCIGDQARPRRDRVAMPLRRRMPPVASQGLDMEMKRRQAVAHVVGAAGCDLEQRGEVARHRIGPYGFRLDHAGIAVAGLAARLPAIDQRDRPAAPLQMQRGRNAHHAAAENDRAFHSNALAKSKPPGLAGRFRLDCPFYSPPPNRRDHHPARRGAAGVSVAACGAGSGAGGATGSGADATGVAGSLALLDRKLTFSRTVERRRAPLSSAGSSSAAAGCRGWGA
jgi:hypothetical protein